MDARRLTLRAVALLATFGLGAWLGARFRGAPGNSTTTAIPAAASIAERDELRSENARLKADLAQRASHPSGPSPSATDAAISSTTDRLRILADLSQRRLASTFVQTFNHRERGVLSTAFIELFGLSGAEHAALQASVDRARERIAGLEAENSSVVGTANGELTVKVRPFPQAGGVVHDDLIRDFAATLGPERHGAFLTLAAGEMERSLGGLGTAERTITFSRAGVHNAARPFYVREAQTIGAGVTTRTVEFKTYEEMAAWAGTVTRLLPKDFTAKK